MCQCKSCEDLIYRVNKKIACIGDNFLNNKKYEFNLPVDMNKLALLRFYRELLNDLCCGSLCSCTKLDEQSIKERINILTV